MSPRRRGRGHGPRPASASVAAGPGAAETPATEDGTAGEVAVAATRNEPRQAPVAPAPRRAGNDAPPRRDAAPRWQAKPAAAAAAPAAAPTGTAAADEAATDAPEPVGAKSSCTLAQMRRFIKSRPYVPVHELRRRFLIEGIEDEVSPMSTGKGMLYVGLPEREAGFLGELVKAGEVGCELLLDPTSPGVIGVFPMRPVARQ